VFDLFTPSRGRYPGENAAGRSADGRCQAQLPRYIGDASRASLYTAFALPPDQPRWDMGYRLVSCVLSRTDSRTMTSTARTPR
jgi:hypothetical protein